MSNYDRTTNLRPLPEQEGSLAVEEAERLITTVADILTLIGLFVSWGSGVEGFVAVCGIVLKHIPLPKRFLRWVGAKNLPKLKF